MPDSRCFRCDTSLAADDNFCRRCGVSTHADLPVVRENLTPALWRPPQVPPIVKGAAVMAAGTVGQYVLRRVVTGILRSSGSDGGTRRQRALRRRPSDGMVDEAQVITETVMMRRVRIRRQA